MLLISPGRYCIADLLHDVRRRVGRIQGGYLEELFHRDPSDPCAMLLSRFGIHDALGTASYLGKTLVLRPRNISVLARRRGSSGGTGPLDAAASANPTRSLRITRGSPRAAAGAKWRQGNLLLRSLLSMASQNHWFWQLLPSEIEDPDDPGGVAPFT